MKNFYVTAILCGVLQTAAGGEGWNQYMGPHRNGSVKATGLIKGTVQLEQLWQQPLGSGFSGLVVDGGHLYAMHQAGSMDAISAFDAATGKKRWTYEYGTAFPKVGSSEPGPLSTPVLDGPYIYGLGAKGELFCLSTADGKVLWSRNIITEFGAISRDEGLASSPLISGRHLILNVGDQKDKGTAAFDKLNGKLIWHVGPEAISFQTPAEVELLGLKQIIGMSNSKLRGLDPDSGRIFWEQDSDDWIQAIPAGMDQVLVGHYHGFALYQFSRFLGQTEVRKAWQNEVLRLEYDMPVIQDGLIYGFKGKVLTCLDLRTGNRVWSTRDAGGGMTIMVDGHLAILSDDGHFRIAEVSSKGYKEVASLKVFEKSGLTAPSYADGVFYVRNYESMAAIKLKAAGA